MTLALFQELLMALRANDVDGYKSWLVLGIEELGRDVLVRLSLTGWCPYWWKREGQAYGLAAGSELVVLTGYRKDGALC